MDSWQVLIVILSITLTIFLIVGIILGVFLIQVVRNVRNFTQKAEDVASNISEASEYIRPAMLAATISKFINKTTKSKRRKEAEDDE